MIHVLLGINAKPHTCGGCFRWEFNRPEGKPFCSLFKKPLHLSGERSDCMGTYVGDMSYEFYRCLECLQAEAEITVKVDSPCRSGDYKGHNDEDVDNGTFPAPGPLLNPMESFCERYPSLGHALGEDGVCVGCGKKFSKEKP